MARSKDPYAYSADFHAIIGELTALHRRHREVPVLEIPCETAQEAMKLRFTWYAFANAMKRQAERFADELATYAKYELVVRTEHPPKMIFRLRTENPLSKRMMNAVMEQLRAHNARQDANPAPEPIPDSAPVTGDAAMELFARMEGMTLDELGELK